MIKFENNLFHLSTKNTSYIIGVVNDTLLHFYWGKKIKNLPSMKTLIPLNGKFCLSTKDFIIDGVTHSTDNLTMEFPTFGSADLRSPALHIRYNDGSTVTKLLFKSYEIENGKYSIKGLPATYDDKKDTVSTLKIHLFDELKKIKVTLLYGVYENYDAITRSVIIENQGEKIKLLNAMSASVDFKTMDYDFIHLYGSWARERKPQRSPLINGKQEIQSARGASSAQHNPFFMLADKNATELNGDVFGFNLLYSGNFVAGVETDTYNVSRSYIGINPFDFEYILDTNDTFSTPEAVMVYSDQGLSGASRIYHKLYNNCLVRGKFKNKERYVLINNWEATYFDFKEEDIINIAKKASEIGVELMVLDDGWFGKRDNDSCSLGDWYVNKNKIPSGMDGLSEKIESNNMKFGLWFEPEMVSPDSDLYRSHPDWCIHIDGRKRNEERNQLILDLSRKDVCDYIINTLSEILQNAKISYIKWDMNRNMSEVGSALLDSEHQGELYHRYILGLYSIFETLTSKYPDILFEACASGGGRFDAGMLYYMPQVWTSDDSDAEERLSIQYGTSFCYPYSSMGCHVSAVPNHQVGRTTPFKFRCDVAMLGQLGFELDLNKISNDDLKTAEEKIKEYKELGEIFHTGGLYRLNTPDKFDFVANEFLSEDEKTVILTTYMIKGTPSINYNYIKLAGLDEDAIYTDNNGNKYFGEELMKIGLKFQCCNDHKSEIIIFKKD